MITRVGRENFGLDYVNSTYGFVSALKIASHDSVYTQGILPE